MALTWKWKTAATRAVREWRALQSGYRSEDADAIAQGYGQLGLKPRFLENLSGGGQEAAVDLRMGRAMGPEANPSGYVAAKLYKPDSLITQGNRTTALLNQKKEYTDAARSLSPESRSMVPAMYGHRTLQGPAGMIRHVSEHEYVPHATDMLSSPRPVDALKQVQRHVAEPMAARGMPLGDIARVDAEHGIRGNVSNTVLNEAGTPQVLDFLPQGKGRVTHVHPTPRGDAVVSPAASSEARGHSYFDKHNVNELRREVYRPERTSFPRPMTAIEKAQTQPAPRAPALRPAPAIHPPGPGGALGTARTEVAGLGNSLAQKATPLMRAPTAIRQAATPVLRNLASMATPILKRAAISDEQALASLDRLEAIEQTKPTAGQLGRYAVLGGVSGPVIGALGDAIGGRPIFGGGSVKARARGALAGAATGALASGAIPLVRTHLDQEAEKKLLRGYVDQHAAEPKLAVRAVKARKVGPGVRKQYHRSDFAGPAKRAIASVDGRVTQQTSSTAVQSALGRLFGGGKGKEKDSAMWGGTPSRRMGEDYPVDLVKAGFQTSAYDGGIGYPAVRQASQVPPLKPKSLRAVVEKEAAGAPTRGGFLMASNIPPLRQLPLEGVVEKKGMTLAEFIAHPFWGPTKQAGIPTTPAGQLAKSQAIGKPRVTPPAGPSIAQIAKPKGFGTPIPGATK